MRRTPTSPRRRTRGTLRCDYGFGCRSATTSTRMRRRTTRGTRPTSRSGSTRRATRTRRSPTRRPGTRWRPAPATTFTATPTGSATRRAVSVGTAQWMATATTPDWRSPGPGLQRLPRRRRHTANTMTYGAPDHANGTGGNTANSHDKHPYACSVCHNDTIDKTRLQRRLDVARAAEREPARRRDQDAASGRDDGDASRRAARAPARTSPATAGTARSGVRRFRAIRATSATRARRRSEQLGSSTVTPALINSDEWATPVTGGRAGRTIPTTNIGGDVLRPAPRIRRGACTATTPRWRTGRRRTRSGCATG